MRLIKNYLYNAGNQILLLLVPLITVPYVSRVLGPHNSGINAYTNSWVTFFYLVGQMGVMMYGNREIAYTRDNLALRSKTFWEIALLQIIMSSLSLLVYVVAILATSSPYKLYFLYQSLWIIAYGLDISWYFMGIEDFKKTVVRNSVVKIISVALIFIIVRGNHDLSKYILLLGFAQLAGSLTLWPYLKDSINRVKLSKLNPFSHFKGSLLLFIPTITTQIYMVINRIMLGRMSTQSLLGQFDYADKIIKLVLAIVTAASTVMLPHMANKFASGDLKGIRNSLYNSFDFVTAFSMPLMFGIMAIASSFAPWFLGIYYAHTGYLMFLEAPMILFIAWSSVTGNQYLMPVKRAHEYTLSVTIGAVINILANYILIKLLNVSGAAIASVISEFAIAGIQLWMVRKSIVISKLFDSFWKYMLSGVVMFTVVFNVNTRMTMNIFSLVIQMIIGMLIYIGLLFLLRAPIIKQAYTILKNNN
ncbi:oligosaccharide flippase family protein [Limosilactobacillus caccae]|uniref:oligosaccharide flippase family protein n=1 Tax=Limosilactobacillus caccae TaxID=1926284 RepID=UPI000970E5FB|nr:polysaccharide biosynthesis C-terminal domain-containing protein [Limosilactobacillus caccae]